MKDKNALAEPVIKTNMRIILNRIIRRIITILPGRISHEKRTIGKAIF